MTKDKPKISHSRGRGSMNHNNRLHYYKNVDESRTKDNIYYAKESLAEAYNKCFSEVVEKHNQKQKRSDRKIEDYYKHLFGNASKLSVATSQNKEQSFYEIVVGIGDKNTCPTGSEKGKLAAKILDEYAKDFSSRNPNFYVFNSVLHLDESTPHLHIDYIPVATGYKNGMEKRNSSSKALEEMGFGKHKDSINEWRKSERKILNELCQKYGLEIKKETQGRGKTYTPDMYKKAMAEAKEDVKIDPEFMDDVRREVYYDLVMEDQYLIEQIEQHKQEEAEALKKAMEAYNSSQKYITDISNQIEKEMSKNLGIAKGERLSSDKKSIEDIDTKAIDIPKHFEPKYKIGSKEIKNYTIEPKSLEKYLRRIEKQELKLTMRNDNLINKNKELMAIAKQSLPTKDTVPKPYDVEELENTIKQLQRKNNNLSDEVSKLRADVKRWAGVSNRIPAEMRKMIEHAYFGEDFNKVKEPKKQVITQKKKSKSHEL